jgi:hypothetical protein
VLFCRRGKRFALSADRRETIEQETEMKTFTFAMVAVSAIALAAMDTRSATADGFSIQFASPGYGRYSGRTNYPYNTYYGSRYGSYYSGYGDYHPYGGHTWHDTSHWDYHPGGFVRHYDHYDYVPGHFDYHQEGHWDHHHW